MFVFVKYAIRIGSLVYALINLPDHCLDDMVQKYFPPCKDKKKQLFTSLKVTLN